jgi:hypothetical protein
VRKRSAPSFSTTATSMFLLLPSTTSTSALSASFSVSLPLVSA